MRNFSCRMGATADTRAMSSLPGSDPHTDATSDTQQKPTRHRRCNKQRRCRASAVLQLLGLILTSTTAAVPCYAADASTSNQAAAEVLFDEAKALLQAEQYDLACPKFAASQKLDPGTGTLIYLGTCYEKQGKYASAWGIYREAVASARTLGQADRQKLATTKADSVEQMVSKLAVDVPNPASALEVFQDGTRVDQATWGSLLPLDPGPHKLEARAVGYLPYTQDIQITKGERRRISIPGLVAESPKPTKAEPVAVTGNVNTGPVTTPPGPSAAAISPNNSNTTRYLGIGLMALGGASLVTGGITGGMSLSKASEVKSNCAGQNPCPIGFQPDANSSRSLGTISTIAFLFGAASVGIGVVTYLVGGNTEQTKTAKGRTELRLGANAIWLTGSFQ
jgi:hypothetical protein